jgi:hypothetical protein
VTAVPYDATLHATPPASVNSQPSVLADYKTAYLHLTALYHGRSLGTTLCFPRIVIYKSWVFLYVHARAQNAGFRTPHVYARNLGPE